MQGKTKSPDLSAGTHLSNDKHNIYEDKDTIYFASYISTNQQLSLHPKRLTPR